MTKTVTDGEYVEIQCPHCGRLVRENLRRFEAGVRDPNCHSCGLRIKFSDEDRSRIIEDHKQWKLARLRHSDAK